ncbi:hypothetical protein Tco_0966501 [Tanacetum coccineum]
MEASLKHEVEISVLINHECEDNYLHVELEQAKKNSIEIQEGLQAKIKILEKDVQRCQKQSVDFELKLQHAKEKHKWESTLNNKNTNPLDYSWISKMEKLENENVSLDFKVQSLMKERDNVKIEYQKLFDSIKKTRSQSQKEMDELIAHVSEKTYAYGAIRAENQNLLSTISELKTRLETVEKAPGMYRVVTTQESQTNEAKSDLSSTGMNAASSVRRPMNRDSHVKNSVLANSKNSAKKVAVYVRKNKQTDNTSANVISNKENVNDVNVSNAAKAKTLLCVSCMQNVLIPCHDKCLAKYKLNVHSNDRRALSTNSKTPTSLDTTYVVLNTRFSDKLTQSKSLDTTSVVSKPKIAIGSASKAIHKVTPQTTAISNIKLPILKKEEYDIWAIEMEHYLEYIDNDVWKVIQNGNSKKRISTRKDGVIRILPPVTAAEIQAVEKERKAKNILLMLEAHGAKVSTEDANHKFLRSLPLAWSNLAMTMRTKPDVDTLSIDDLYNNLRVFEQEIQGALKISSSAQNVAFVSQSKSIINKVKSGFTGAYSTCTPSTSSINIPKKEVLVGFADEVIYSLFAKQSED